MTNPSPRRDRPLPHPDLASLPEDGGEEYNRLIFTSSPYLLQHARNPVDWYPWGEEAFRVAKERDLPVFLSVGYSTCHWCHVMERESFEDPALAAWLNRHFVSIKVDREERPDIDAVYMAVCQAMTGQGGWPLTVMLTPDAVPFFAGTYFPPEDRYGRPGFRTLLERIHEAWTTQRDRVLSSGRDLLATVSTMHDSHPGDPDVSWIEAAVQGFRRSYDAEHGGFGRAPKFPMAHTLSFLLLRHRRSGERELKDMVLRTLDAVRRGGIFDQVGGGVCRYSTDARWFAPHFEKMLYDNALLLTAVTDAWLVSKEERFAESARRLIEYTSLALSSPEGLWYSAEDADSEGREGAFYLFTMKEWIEVLGADRGPALASYFGLTEEGNFEEGGNILSEPQALGEWASAWGLDPDTAATWIAEARLALGEARRSRVHPSLDDKMIAAWNGLMLAALAHAARAFDVQEWKDQARTAARALRRMLVREDGRVWHSWRGGRISGPGFLDDQSFCVHGLLALYHLDGRPEDLALARELHLAMLRDFIDPAQGLLHDTARDAESLPVRPRSTHDGALPAGLSMAVWNGLRLSHLLDAPSLADQAWKELASCVESVESSPTGHTVLLTALDGFLHGMMTIVVSAPDIPSAQPFLDLLRSHFLPEALIHLSLGENSLLLELAPHLSTYPSPVTGPSVTICRDGACHPPLRTVEELTEVLHLLSPSVPEH